jgi:predicted DNA-binding transcriptional regulator YafY
MPPEEEVNKEVVIRTPDRYFLVLEALNVVPNYQSVNDIKEMLARHGHVVTERTVQRILEYFQSRFGLISRDKPNAAGRPPKEWAWSKKKGPPRLQPVDPPSALTLQLAIELLAPVLPDPYMKDMTKDLARARKALGQISPAAKKLPQKIKILPRGRGRLPATVDQKILNNVFNALLAERRILVRYLSGSGQQQTMAEHELSPLGLIFRFDTFYLVHIREPKSKSQDANLVMEWPLHRFRSVKPLETKIRVPQNFDLNEHLDNPGFIQNHFVKKVAKLGPEIKLKLLFSEITARYVMERPFSEDQKRKTSKDGRVLITATTRNTRELLSELLNFSDDVEVLAPKALRDYFREVSENLCARYQS